MVCAVSSVEIIEVAPRDGLQNQSSNVSTSDKIRLIEQLHAAGAKRMEIASFVNPARVPQMADAEAVIKAVRARPGLIRIGLVMNERGLARALATDIDEIGMVAVSSDTFGLKNQKQTWQDSVAMARRVVARAKSEGRRAQVTIAVAFGCPYEGEVPIARVVRMAREIAEAGPHEIALADTIGVAVPAQVKELVDAVRADVPDIPLRCHFHNTRNTGIANAWAAVEAGIARLDSSAGGIGGCPFAPKATGNIATEDLVYLLERSGVSTGFDLAALTDLAPWLARILALQELPAMVSRAQSFPSPQAAC